MHAERSAHKIIKLPYPLSAVPSNAKLYVKGVKGYTQMLPQGSAGPGVTRQNMVPSGEGHLDEQLA